MKTKFVSLFILIIIIIFSALEIKEYNDIENRRLLFIEQIQEFDFNKIPLENLPILDNLNNNILEMGKNEMSKHKVIFAGIARDNLKDLPTTIKHIYFLSSFFKDYRIVIFENDSKDGTKQAFETWMEKDKKVKILSKTYGIKKRPNHKFLADARNEYLQEIKEYEDFDLVIMLDMDMSHGVDARGNFDSFSKINDWDMVCSNGISNSK
ncbi:MAG: hypothetical protein AABY27_02585, partial [Pseudomonadota bacterium]